MARDTYHSEDLADAVVDLVRVGVSNNSGGVRQIATRLMRSVPTGVPDPEAFREQLSEAIVATRMRPTFRSASAFSIDDRNDLVSRTAPTTADLPPLVLPPDTQAAVDGLIVQWTEPDRLIAVGVEPAHTILLRGGPGVGKTLIATHIAALLGLPLLSVNLAEIVSSLLGGTGRNLREALTSGWRDPCVLLLDEFDAVAKRRDDSSDIGELKRIVNVLILELDQWPHHRLLVAATNHAHLLDSAVTRRFELVLDVPYPGEDERARALTRLLQSPVGEPLIRFTVGASAGLSLAELEKLVRSALRRTASNDTAIERALVVEIADHQAGQGVDRDALLLSAKELIGLSNRELGRLFGISHPTVAAAIRRAKEVRV